MIVGNNKEKALLNEIAHNTATNYFSSDLRIFLILLKRASLLVTTDSGPLHMAIALNIKTLAIFSPTDPKLSGPYMNYNNINILYKPPSTCNICSKRKCKNPICLKKISAYTVFNKIKQII